MGSIGLPNFVGFDLTEENKSFMPFIFELLCAYDASSKNSVWVLWYLRYKFEDDFISRYKSAEIKEKNRVRFDIEMAKIDAIAAPLLKRHFIQIGKLKIFINSHVLSNALKTPNDNHFIEAPQEQNIFYIKDITSTCEPEVENFKPGQVGYSFLSNLFAKIDSSEPPTEKVIDWLKAEFASKLAEYGDSLATELLFKSSRQENEKAPMNTRVLDNIILVGPPGTGKTHEAKRLAGEAISIPRNRWTEADKTTFADQVTVVQFHPSTSYEDFIEGIRPIVAHDGTVKYEVVSGPMKLAMIKANPKAYLSVGVYVFDHQIFPVEQTWAMYNLPLKFSEVIFKEQSATNHFTSINFEEPPPTGATFRQIKIRALSWATEREPKKYIVIIDEINRGKVSQILGELLFAISDKDDLSRQIEVISQYSRDKLTWHPNVCIVGTMNNADKSIDDIDQALRRRFEFRHLLPNYQLLEKLLVPMWSIFGGNPIQLLKETNDAISIIMESADYQIGHSYLLKIKSKIENGSDPLAALTLVFFKEILPTIESIVKHDPTSMETILSADVFEMCYGPKKDFLPGIAIEISTLVEVLASGSKPKKDQWKGIIDIFKRLNLIGNATDSAKLLDSAA